MLATASISWIRKCITEHELSHTIVYPMLSQSHHDADRRDDGGLWLGLACHIASPVVLEYVGRGIKLREAIEGCRVYESSSREIPAPILKRCVKRLQPITAARCKCLR